MKKIFLLLLGVFSLLLAEPLSKPSSKEITNLIKKLVLDKKPSQLVGIDSYDNQQKYSCINPKITKLKILKIGRASSNYYERSGNYINSDFKVKFIISGSCNISQPFMINFYALKAYTREIHKYNKFHSGKKPIQPVEKNLRGNLPYKDIPFEVIIGTDDYGDWTAYGLKPFSEEDVSFGVKNKDYLTKLYNHKFGTEVAIIKKQRENLEKAQKEKREKYQKLEREFKQRESLNREKESSLKNRVATVRKHMLTSEDQKNYKKLEKICQKNRWKSCYGYVSNCYTENGIKHCPSTEISLENFENFYLPLVEAQNRYSGKIVKRLGYEYKGGVRSREDISKFTKVFKNLMEKYHNIKTKYDLKSRKYKGKFFDYLYYQESTKAREIVLQEFAKKL